MHPEARMSDPSTPKGAYAPFSAKFARGVKYLGLDKTARATLLDSKSKFARCKQHDHNRYTWDRVNRDPGVGYLHERLRAHGHNTVENAPGYGGRVPDAPAPLGKTIVNEFTAMLLSPHARPMPLCPGDDDSTAYLEAAFQATGAWEALTLARSAAGSCGSSALTFCIDERGGHWSVVPTAETGVDWEPYHEWVPRQMFRQFCVIEMVEDEDGVVRPKEMVRTTVWDDKAEIVYKSVPLEEAREKPVPTIATTTEHKLGMCPVVWYQNVPCHDHPDGECDYEDLWRPLDKIDHLQSQGAHSALANADPTLALSDSPGGHKERTRLLKGSKGIIKLSEAGRAQYVESSGQGPTTAWDIASRMEEQVLRAAQCVIMDAEMMKNYDSGEAVQFRYRPMEARCDMLRGPLSRVIVRMAEILLAAAKSYSMEQLRIPAREVTEGEEVTYKPHKLGGAKLVTTKCGAYWRTTPLQAQAIAGTLTAATAGKAVLSQGSAATVMARALGIDPLREVELVEEEKEEERELMEEAMADATMGVPDSVGAAPTTTPGAPAAKPKSKDAPAKGKGSPSQPKGSPGSKAKVPKKAP